MDYKQFAAQLADAYEHIYDLVYLRNHSLIDLLFRDNKISRKDSAWQLHHLLLDTIQELDPGPQAPAFSREWRRHRLMVLRYADGLTPQTVADQLAISRRHYYREHEMAIEAIAEVLLKRLLPDEVPVTSSNEAPNEAQPAIVDRMELLRLEAAQMVQIERRTMLHEVLSGVIALLSNRLHEHDLTIESKTDEPLPAVWADHRLIRQLLLALLGHLVNVSEDGHIIIEAFVQDQRLQLHLFVSPPSAITGSVEADPQTPFSVFEELAVLSGVSLVPYTNGPDHLSNDKIVGFTIHMSLYAAQRTILVVDDNQDILELFYRYLKSYHYEVIQGHTYREALEKATQAQPFAIILDLMMPGQDGWDLLQVLQNQPETRSIPIVICSILRQKELALSLGATAFLEKPVSEQALLSVLNLISPDVIER
jgi:CheY-like chemotaxis protein